MKFFKIEDFKATLEIRHGVITQVHNSLPNKMESAADAITIEQAVDQANAKLDHEGVTLYTYRPGEGTWFTDKTNKQCEYCGGTEVDCCRFYSSKTLDTHKALLINIEPIEKCTHPKEKVKRQIEYQPTVKGLPTAFRESFDCECGAVVTPNTFEEV